VAYCWYLAHGRSAARTSENSRPNDRALVAGGPGAGPAARARGM